MEDLLEASAGLPTMQQPVRGLICDCCLHREYDLLTVTSEIFFGFSSSTSLLSPLSFAKHASWQGGGGGVHCIGLGCLPPNLDHTRGQRTSGGRRRNPNPSKNGRCTRCKCKRFWNSVKRYKSVPFVIFLVEWKKQGAGFVMSFTCCHFCPKIWAICDRNGLFSDNDSYHFRPLYP